MQQFKNLPRGLAAATVAATFVLTACGGGGGGGDSASGGGGGTSTAADTTVGPITGFGSVIVNGVRFEDNAARVNDDSGNTISSSNLRLGMTVEIRGSIGDDGTGTANSISLFSELKGPLSNLNTAAGTFSILGFNVVTDGSTVYEDVSGLSGLTNGDVVEVYGVRNGNTVTASRVEKKTGTSSSTEIKLRGQVSALNAGATTFALGSTTVNFGSATITPSAASLVDGAFVAVRSSSTSAGGVVNASRIQVVGNVPFSADDGGKLELNGVVSSFTSISSFVISGITVDASSATFLRGSASQVGVGTHLEVEGPYSNGVLTASKAKFEDGSGIDEFELHGTVSNFSSLASFQVRGVTVDASGSGVLFERGTAGDVANGRSVEVEGSVQSSSGGSILVASKLKFEDVSGSGGSDDNSGGSGSGSGSDDSGSSGGGSGSGASGGDDSGGSSGGNSSSSGEFEFKGTISSVSGNTLVVGGRTVSITSGTSFRRITQQQLVAGAFVEIKGSLQSDGSVIADRISLED